MQKYIKYININLNWNVLLLLIYINKRKMVCQKLATKNDNSWCLMSLCNLIDNTKVVFLQKSSITRDKPELIIND